MSDMESIRDTISVQLRESLNYVLGRMDDAYPFFDTKFDLVSGERFSDDDAIRSHSIIYTWVQGRALESMTAHARWLKQFGGNDHGVGALAIERMEGFLHHLPVLMEQLRDVNAGRLPFMMRSTGVPLNLDANRKVEEVSIEPAAATSLSDLFYAKGLMAAAHYVDRRDLCQKAESLFRQIIEDVHADRFRSGQVCLDPKNRAGDMAGRKSHAARMIGIGAATLFYECTGNVAYGELGNAFIDDIISRHVAKERRHYELGLEEGDFWEFVDEAGQPWMTPEGELISDPGHATEFVGLALAHLKATGRWDAKRVHMLRQMLIRNYANGFTGKGIVKAFDLKSRCAINTDMPWWSLPETMRAAHFGMQHGGFCPDLERIFAECWDAFQQYFVLPDRGYLARQCLQEDGQTSTAIPAVPDADPCYHTGLALLDCLKTR